MMCLKILFGLQALNNHWRHSPPPPKKIFFLKIEWTNNKQNIDPEIKQNFICVKGKIVEVFVFNFTWILHFELTFLIK